MTTQSEQFGFVAPGEALTARESDRELLQWAAKAAGLDLDWDVPPKSPPWVMTGEGDDRGPAHQWNPLTDDGDALRLAVLLTLDLKLYLNRAIAIEPAHDREFEVFDDDPCAAARRAIVLAAAEMGKNASSIASGAQEPNLPKSSPDFSGRGPR